MFRGMLVKPKQDTNKPLSSVYETKMLGVPLNPDRGPINKVTIWYNVKRYLHHGTIQNRQEKHSGRRRTGRSQENVDAVQAALENNPSGLTCRVNTVDLPSGTFNRIVRFDLKWHPYKMKLRHQLKPRDFEQRRGFCE